MVRCTSLPDINFWQIALESIYRFKDGGLIEFKFVFVDLKILHSVHFDIESFSMGEHSNIIQMANLCYLLFTLRFTLYSTCI